MAAGSRFATVSEDDFALKCFFFLFFEIITCVFILKQLLNINFLLTESEGRTGEYWPEVVAVRTERSEVLAKTTEGQYSPVRLELARIVSSLLYGFLITFCFVFASP